MRIAIHPHHEHEPYRLPHQGLWFVLLLIVLLLLSSKNVSTVYGAADQWVMAYNRILIPIA